MDNNIAIRSSGAHGEPANGQRPGGAGNAHALRILIVDDLVDAAETLALYLRMFGHVVRTAYDGFAALQAAVDFQPHVIILDIALPRLDGYRVAEQLRQDANLQTVCLIALSGYGSQADQEAARRAGFDYHFLKPVEPSKLLATVSQCGGRPPQSKPASPLPLGP